MRIAVFNWKDLAHPASGGAEVWTHEVCAAWAAAGHEVTLFCAAVAGRPSIDVAPGGAYRIVRSGTRTSVYRDARLWWESHAAGRFDVVVDEVNTRPFGAARWAAPTPVVAIAHQVAREVWFSEMPLPAALVGRFVAEPVWLRRLRDVPTFTVSESSAVSLRAYGIRDVRVLPQGSDLTGVSHQPKADELTFAFCGRLVDAKRPQHALDAFAAARDALGEGRMVVIGDGPARDRLVVPDGAHLAGSVSHAEKFSLMGSAHALLVTSVREGWGLVVSEAAAAGTVSVAYPVPGLVDSVPAADGILAAQPTPEALSAAIVANAEALRSARPSDHGTVAWPVVADEMMAGICDVLEGRTAPVLDATGAGAR